MAAGNPLIEALPPATDYLTYLTVIEYNLTTENLSILHDVLQDAKLTTNIGWDLVHLLVPMLPASDQCLQDIARLGNPREVILKVTESLRLIDYAGLEPESDEDPAISGADPELGAHPVKTAAIAGDAGQTPVSGTTQAVELAPPPPLPVLQFTTLLSMLSILHPRIKTKYPSRFLSTTLQAILASFSHSVSHYEELVSAVVRFIKNLSGMKRPHLPPRKSSTQMLSAVSNAPVPDPEPDTESATPSSSEAAMQSRLLQSFVTHILEDYMLTMSSDEDVPGLAWCTRLQERLQPGRTIPGKRSLSDKFASDERLHVRLTAVGEILAMSQDLDISLAELLTTVESATLSGGASKPSNDEDDPPKSASDIPLSKMGSLFLFTARNVDNVLYHSKAPEVMLDIFPTHRQILANFVSDSNALGGKVGTEPEPVLDALVALAFLSLEANQIGEPADAEDFNQYLQLVSLISSNCPSPSLRYHAFYITTTVLRSNPSDAERLGFIRDTLEHCPFDNLKVAAVSWIKGETIEANPPAPVPGHSHSSASGSQHNANADDPSVFATPIALDTLAPFLFPDLTHDLSSPDLMESYMSFEQNLPFYLASLNLYYLLLSAPHLHQRLGLGSLHSNNDVAGSFLQPLREASAKFRRAGKDGGELARKWEEDADANERMGELELLDATLEKVTSGIAGLNKT